MKPVNQPARRAAINRFLILYGVSLIAIVVCAWIILSIPNGLLQKSILGYKSTELEQTTLVHKIEGMTTNLKSILQTDQAYINSTNEIEKGGLMASLQEYQKKINDALVDVKNDTSALLSPISKKNANSSIVAFNAILSFRNTLTALQKSLQEKGGDAEQLIKLQGELDKCNSQLDIFKIMAAAKPPPAAPSGGGGGGGKGKEAELQKQLEDAQAQLALCQQAIAAGAGKNAGGLDEAKKATIYFEAGESLYTTAGKTKNLIEKRGILSSAKSMFEKAKDRYASPDRVKKNLDQIDAELKKLRNMG